MAETSKTGGCLCGAVRYTLAETPKSYGACHCSMCRRWSGGIELGIQTTADAISFENNDHIRVFKSSDWAERAFCDICGSNLYWKLTAPGPHHGMMSLSAGSLDDLGDLKLDHEVYIDHKPDGHAFAGERTRMTEADIMAMMNPDGAEEAE
ncbi:GFA family protein [Aliiroseovarius sp. YM-037]|uniref:GFA family protein n=1 Tax=Aliiroseovarius sp. YM-037 TaxID=3341728 RepID=UPI003A7FD6CC